MPVDILLEIPDEDLPKLAEMYLDLREQIPYAHTHILTGIKWKEKGKKDYMRFYSPNASWKKDGTFITINQSSSYHVTVFSLKKSEEIVYEAIKNTTKIVYDTPVSVIFYALYATFREPVMKALRDRNHNIKNYPAYIMCMRKANAEKLQVSIPPNLYIKKLDTSFAPIINSLWPEKYEGSEKYIECLLELNDGYGIFLKSNDQLVCWCLITIIGQLGTLQTAENHKKKGYGSLMTLFMAKERARNGFDALGTVSVLNTPSKNMFDKLGFTCLGICNYLTVLP